MMDMAITIDLEKINRNHEEVHFHVLSIDSRFLFSVTLWFTGNKLEGIFVGIWVPSILSLTSVLAHIRQGEVEENRNSNSSN